MKTKILISFKLYHKKGENKMKNLYYFTFGCGQKNEGFVQPILANSWGEARAKIVEINGNHWAFQYTEAQWNKWKKEVMEKNIPISIEKELPTITTEGD